MKKTFEMKNQSVIPKQEEKYFIFSELKTKLSYTQNEYWVKETKSRLNIILEKYNNFIAENSEDKDNELYIESFKSLILNQLRHVSKEMNFISFSKQVIGEIFKHAKQTINEKENKEFALIVNVNNHIYLKL